MGRRSADPAEHERARQARLARKLAKVEDQWTPDPRTWDRSWQRWAKCKVCGQRYCVNNNKEREVRPWRTLGVPVCATCWSRRGAERITKMYKLVKRMASFDPTDSYEWPEDMIRQLILDAQELMQ